MDDEVTLAELSVRICYDTLPSKELLFNSKFSVYSYAHNEINIPLIATTIRDSKLPFGTYILDNKTPMSGVSDSSKISRIYANYGVGAQKIPYNETWINTKIESDTVAQWAAENEIELLIICAPVFHMVRAYMTLVSSLIDKNLDKKINVYALASKMNEWKDTTISHQGKQVTSYNNFIKLENLRIIKYQEKGDIRSNKEIWNFLVNRY